MGRRVVENGLYLEGHDDAASLLLQMRGAGSDLGVFEFEFENPEI